MERVSKKNRNMKEKRQMKLGVNPNFPYGLNQYDNDQIEEMGLKIIYNIQTSEIEYNNETLKAFFGVINKECKDKHVWVLFGSIDTQKGYWIPLQVASKQNDSENVIGEIRTDFLCMTSYSEDRDLKDWNSFFYQSVMKMKCGFDTKCQKYQKMREMCDCLAVAIIENEDSFVELEDRKISKYQKKECDIALKLMPLFWNPAGKEFTYINEAYRD